MSDLESGDCIITYIIIVNYILFTMFIYRRLGS